MLPFVSLGQYENLLHKSYAENIEGYSKLYVSLIDLKDSVAIAKKTDAIKAFALAHQDKALELEMDLFTCYHNIEFKGHHSQKCIDDLVSLIARATKVGAVYVKIRAIRVLANYYWVTEKNYELAFEQYLLLEKEIDRLSAADYPEKPRDLVKIAEAYYSFQDYSKAEFYFKKALEVPENEFNTMVLNSARNTLGLCYQMQKNYELSDYYFNQVVATRFEKPKKEWVRIAKGNLGANYYLKKQYDLAIPLLVQDFSGAEEISDFGPAAGAAMPLADIYLSRGDRQKAWFYLSQARIAIARSEQTDRLRFWYPIMSKWYGAAGNQKEADIYLDSTIDAINAYQKQFSALKMMQASQKISLREDALKKAELELDRQKKNNERNLLVLTTVCLGFVAVAVYKNQKRQRLMAEAGRDRLKSELQVAQSRIDRFVQRANEQNHLMERLQRDLQKLRAAGTGENEALERTISELRSATILTAEDWSYFKQHFATIYPDFEPVLKQRFAQLTESELRYLMLSKLQLSHKEMAQVLGISSDGVRVTWNRVRKKMSGALDQNPQQLLASVGL